MAVVEKSRQEFKAIDVDVPNDEKVGRKEQEKVDKD